MALLSVLGSKVENPQQHGGKIVALLSVLGSKVENPLQHEEGR